MTGFEIPAKSRVALLGGGGLLSDLAVELTTHGYDVFVVTAPRQADELIAPGATLRRSLDDRGIRHVVSDDWKPHFPPAAADAGTFYLSLGAAWIFKKADLEESFKGGLFNLHGTRLPANRGGGGFSWQILNGNRLGFCVLHQIDGGIDSGQILAYREFLYPASCRIPADFIAEYKARNLAFLLDLFKTLRHSAVSLQPISQTEYFSQYWPRLSTKDQAWIDWSWRIDALDRFVCAFDDPYPGAQTFWENTRVVVKKSLADFNDGSFHPFQHGIVYRTNGQWLCVAAHGGSLLVQEVWDDRGRNIVGQIKAGDRFHTPQQHLEARNQRVMYSATGIRKS